MKKLFSFFSLLLLLPFLGSDGGAFYAQQAATYGIAVQYARPVEQFRDNGYRDGFGMSMNLLSRPRFTNPVVGIQYGAQFDIEGSGMSADPLIMPSPETGELAEMEVKNTQMGLHGIARVVTTDRLPVQLYADGMIGSRLFMGQESFEHLDNSYECPEINTLQSDFVFSYGGSLGALIRLGAFGSLDLRTTYLSSAGSAEFIDLQSVAQTEAGIYGYRLERAPASQLRFQLGFNMLLVGGCSRW